MAEQDIPPNRIYPGIPDIQLIRISRPTGYPAKTDMAVGKYSLGGPDIRSYQTSGMTEYPDRISGTTHVQRPI